MTSITDNPAYSEMYFSFVRLRPWKEGYSSSQIARVTDLNTLIADSKSFILYSESRNGTSVLMQALAESQGGLYVNCHSFKKTGNVVLDDLEQKIQKSERHLILLDETNRLFSTSDDARTIDFLCRQSESHKLGLRFHPNHYPTADSLISRGFSRYDVRRIPFADFEAYVKSRFESISFKFPDDAIKTAYGCDLSDEAIKAYGYDLIAISMYHIGIAFKALIEKPDVPLNHDTIRRDFQRKKLQILIRPIEVLLAEVPDISLELFQLVSLDNREVYSKGLRLYPLQIGRTEISLPVVAVVSLGTLFSTTDFSTTDFVLGRIGTSSLVISACASENNCGAESYVYISNLKGVHHFKYEERKTS